MSREAHAAATSMLCAAFGSDTQISRVRSVAGDRGRSAIHRLSLSGPSAPETVISKQLKVAAMPGDNEPLELFSSELASLQFLGGLDVANLVPTLHAYDPVERILLCEDLGELPSLADVLQGGDGAEADAALREYAETLGTLNGGTVACRDSLIDHRQALGLADDTTAWSDDVATLRSDLPEALSLLGLGIGSLIADDLDALVEDLTDESCWPSFTHGDPCPDNNVIESTGRVRFFDFEFSRVRPAMVDAAYLVVPFPTCWCVAQLPASMTEQLESTYRTSFARHVPEAREDARWGAAITAGSAAWMLSEICRRMPLLMENDRDWGLSTWRQRLLYRLPAFVELVERHGQRRALGELAGMVHRQLATEWEDTDRIAGYAAFGD